MSSTFPKAILNALMWNSCMSSTFPKAILNALIFFLSDIMKKTLQMEKKNIMMMLIIIKIAITTVIIIIMSQPVEESWVDVPSRVHHLTMDTFHAFIKVGAGAH